MDATGPLTDPHREITAALRRGATTRVTTTLDRSYLAQIAGVLCMAIGVVVDAPAITIAVMVVGAAFLWMALHRDGRAPERDLTEFFDDATGLPLAAALPFVLTDDHTTRSLTGRLAIATVDVPAIAEATAEGDTRRTEALLAATADRLRGQGWEGDAVGPYGPLVFLRRPGVFVVLLRDVLDDRTTAWLANRMVKILGAPIGWHTSTIDPRASVGVALGDATDGHDLLTSANRARLTARSRGAGSVVVLGDDPTDVIAQLPSPIVSHEDECPAGLEFDLEPRRTAQGELWFGLADVCRNLDRALGTDDDESDLCFVPVAAVTLCRADARQRILERVNVVGAHDRVALVVTPRVADPGMAEGRRTLGVLRQCGLHVYLDAGSGLDDLPALELDGVVVDRDDDRLASQARERRLDVVVRWPVDPVEGDGEATALPMPESVALDHSALLSGLNAVQELPHLDDRPISGGRSTQMATGRPVTTRK